MIPVIARTLYVIPAQAGIYLDLCVVYVLERHVDVMPSAVEAGADEGGHKWLTAAAHRIEVTNRYPSDRKALTE